MNRKFPIALNDFKKIKEDEHAAVLQHPEGHHIVLAKKMMSPKMRGQLSDLPLHKADGGDIPDEEASHSVMAKSPGQAEERGRAADPSFQPQFPAAPGREAPVVINVGQPQQAAAQPPPAPVNRGMPFKNGTVDWDQYYLQSPSAPIESKMKAMEHLQTQKVADQAQSDYQAKQQQDAQQKALQYNQMAAQMGVPPVAVPSAPASQAMPEAPQAQPQALVTSEAAPQMPQDPYGTDAYQKYLLAGVGSRGGDGEAPSGQIGGIQEEAGAQQNLGEQQASILGQQVETQQNQLKSYQDHYDDLEEERQNFQQDLMDQHIDPKRFLNAMGVGQKVSTGIGLILGGMGGGLTHQGNPVLDFLNKQIDRDIDSQKMEMGKTENLLTANMRQFGNLRDATDMTRVMQMEVVKNQLSQAAATAQGPLAKARADQAIGQIDQQIAPIMAQMAMRKSLTNAPQGASSQDPASQIRLQSMMGFIPKEQVEPMFKELKEANEQTKGFDAAMAAFDEMNKINTIGNRVTSPIQTPKQAAALQNNLAVQIARAAAGRVNEYEFESAKQLFPSPGDDLKTIQLKRQQLKNFLQEKMSHPNLTAYGIKTGSTQGGGRFNEAGEKKIKLGAPVLGK